MAIGKDQQRDVDVVARLLGAERQGEGHERDGGDQRPGVALEEVGAHAGDVADVVADVVGDGGRVAGIVLGDAGLDLADQVGAHVGGLGVDAAAHTGEQGDGGGPEPVGGDDLERVVDLEHRDEEDVDDHQAAQRQPGDGEAHDRTAAEGDGKGLGRPVLGRLGGAGVGHGGHGHAGVPGGGRQDRAEDVADRAQRLDEDGDQDGHDDDEGGDPGVLLPEEGLGPVLDLGHQVDHAVVARIGLLHPRVVVGGQDERGDGARECEIGYGVH